MSKSHRRLERLTFIALAAIVGLSFYYWEEVERAHSRTHNLLGTVNNHVPTADLFLWTAAALILYFGTRMWSALAPHVFALSEESAARWRTRLLWARAATTVTFLGLTTFTIFGA